MRKIKGKWQFIDLEENAGIYGINEAGRNNFSDKPTVNLTREICQNSIDASINNETVKVDFHEFSIRTQEIPGYEGLKKAVDNGREYWKQKFKNDDKTDEFYENAQNILNNEFVRVLRISDFGTSGLTGIDSEEGTGDWNNLVKDNGVSDKGDNSGGSFGIGKTAPFVVTGLRTVYYATQNIDGQKGFQGTSILATFYDGKNKKLGRGYFADKRSKFSAIKNWYSLDPNFSRSDEQKGTDLFVAGTQLNENWEDETLVTVIDNFLISILEGKLEVNIGKYQINSETIEDYFEIYNEYQNYDFSSGYAYEYYLTYKFHKPQRKYYYSLFEENDIELIVLFNKENKKISVKNQRVYIARQSGMKVFDKAWNPKIDFSAVLVIRGEEANGFFKKLENPSHTKWENYERFPDTKSKNEAEKKKRKVFDFINQKIKDFIEENLSERLNAEGLSDFLPEKDVNETGEDGEEETLNDIRSTITEVTKGKTKASKGIGDDDRQKTDDLSKDPKGEDETSGNGGKNPSDNPPSRESASPGDGNRKGFKKISRKPKNIKIFPVSDTKYLADFQLDKEVQEIELILYYVGEDGKKETILIKDVDSSINHYFEDNKLYFTAASAMDHFNFSFKKEEANSFSFGVIVNEIQR